MIDRPTTTKTVLHGLQYGRAIAALLVVCCHASVVIHENFSENLLSKIFIGGSSGVQFFFVLSGFIIYYIHSDDDRNIDNAKLFIKKRLLRVYPIYWIALIFTLTGKIAFSSSGVANSIIGDITLISNRYLLTVPVAWTLSHEILFYSIFAAGYYALGKLKNLLIFWLIIIVGYQIFTLGSHHGSNTILNINNCLFASGIFIGYLFKKKSELLKLHYKKTLCTGALLLLTGMTSLSQAGLDRPYNDTRFLLEQILIGLASTFLVAGLSSLPKHQRTSNILITLGNASYSIYLFHLLTQQATYRFLSKIGKIDTYYSSAFFLLLVLLPIFVGTAVHYLIEKPIIRTLSNWIKKSKSKK